MTQWEQNYCNLDDYRIFFLDARNFWAQQLKTRYRKQKRRYVNNKIVFFSLKKITNTHLGETRHCEAEGQGDVQNARWCAPVDARGAADYHQEGRAQDLAEERHQEADPRHLVHPHKVLGA